MHELHALPDATRQLLEDFLDGEVRYASLERTFPENAEKYFNLAAEEARLKYEGYKKL